MNEHDIVSGVGRVIRRLGRLAAPPRGGGGLLGG